MSANLTLHYETVRVALADPMAGVREAWRWLLSTEPTVTVTAEAATVAQALAAQADVILAGLRFPDGTAADLAAATPRPVIVWVFLPEDERADIGLSGAFAVLAAGTLRARLAAVLRQAAGADSG